MGLKLISQEEFLNLSEKEKKIVLDDLKKCSNKYKELNNLKVESKDSINYDINLYDASFVNIKHKLFLFLKDEGYIIFMSSEKLNGIEKYGLLQLTKDSIQYQSGCDWFVEVYEGFYNDINDSIIPNDLSTDYLSKINNIKEKLSLSIDLNINKYAYIIHYKEICKRYEKSKVWRFFHKSKYNDCVSNHLVED